MALPRVTALRLAPDGYLAGRGGADPERRQEEVPDQHLEDRRARRPARRPTRSAEGEGNPRFLPDGSLLFTSRRPDPAARKGPDADPGDVAALWLLPAAGGEARVVAALPGGVTAAEVARDAGGS